MSKSRLTLASWVLVVRRLQVIREWSGSLDSNCQLDGLRLPTVGSAEDRRWQACVMHRAGLLRRPAHEEW